MIEKIESSRAAEIIRRFFESRVVYPVFVLATVLLSQLFGLEMITFGLHLVLAAVGLCFVREPVFLLCPLLSLPFCISFENTPISPVYSDAIYTPGAIAVWVCCAALAALGFIFHIIYFRKRPYRSRLTVGLIVFAVTLMLNGLFSSYFTWMGVLFGALEALVIVGIFFLLHTVISPDGDAFSYLFRFLLGLLATLIVQFAVSFFVHDVYVDGTLDKEHVLLGWGLCNNIGAMLTLLLPVPFYFVCRSKRFGWAFYLFAVLDLGAVALTLSRMSSLVAILLFLACVAVCWFYAADRRTFRILTLIGIACVAVGLVVFWGKVSAVFGDFFTRGVSLNGRDEHWSTHMAYFREYPVFGVGFYAIPSMDGDVVFMPALAHNTWVQLLSNCGVVGLLAYAYHRYETVDLFRRRFSLDNLFPMLIALAVVLMSVMDVHFFYIYPVLFYVVSLFIVEPHEK